jgi:hypothetical protein
MPPQARKPVTAKNWRVTAMSLTVWPAWACTGLHGALDATPRPSETWKLEVSKAQEVFVTQYQHERYHPSATAATNANCGPTSLAMALADLGKAPAGFRKHPEKWIRELRQTMTGNADERAWTYPYQFPAAATRHGVQARLITGGINSVIAELGHPGHVVILNLNPFPAYTSQLKVPLDGGHYVLARARTDRGLQILDPLAEAPLELSLEIVSRALETPLGEGIPPFRGGIALWRADGE